MLGKWDRKVESKIVIKTVVDENCLSQAIVTKTAAAAKCHNL